MKYMKNLKIAVFTLISVMPILCSGTWDTTTPTSYLFAPGIFESERYAASYCGTYKASTGEIVTCKRGINAFQAPYTSITFDEVVLDPVNEKNRKTLGWAAYVLTKIQTLNRHSLEKKRNLTISGKPLTELSIKSWQLDNNAVYFGQEKDMVVLEKAYDQHVANYPTQKLVLYGFSRGAAVMFNFLATEYQKKTEQKVAACVFEACYDVTPLPNLLSNFFTGYDPNGIQPRSCVQHFPKHVPSLFITSAKDNRVSSEKTWKLYYALKKAGHQHLHIFELENSSHPGYTFENDVDRQQYEALLHAFYQKYGLAHDPALALAGQKLLQESQP